MPTGRRRSGRTLAVALVVPAVLVAAALPAAAGAVRSAVPAGVHPSTPNVLVLLSDDQAWSTFNRTLMPAVYSKLVDQGVLFDRAYVNTAQCCPSRSEILTGLYQHHTGVTGNQTPFDRPTIVDALHDRGYRTMLAGKFLNSMPCTPRPEYDRWACTSVGQSDYSLQNPTINLDGTWIQRPGFTTDILGNYLSDFIDATPADRPFFALYSPTSPHLPANDPRYSSMPISVYRPPSYDQETRSPSLPAYLRRPPLTADERYGVDLKHQVMSQAVRALDDSVSDILTRLGSRMNDTLIVYLSDNGYLYGEHRRWEKDVPYEESVGVPMVVRYPSLHPASDPVVSHALVSNVDIAPTIAALVGFPWGADGRSFLPLLSGEANAIRQAVLIEGCQPNPWFCPGNEPGFGSLRTVPAMWGVVTAGAMYAVYQSGEKELYDLRADPYELNNLAGDPGVAGLQRDLATKLSFFQLSPNPQTTIVTGPAGPSDERVVTFTYFSQELRSTYQCRLDAGGVAGDWGACDPDGTTLGPLPDGDYVFEVAGTNQRGITDQTPDTRAFSIHTTGPSAAILTGPPAAGRARTVSFTYSSDTPGASFLCRLSGGSGPSPWQGCDPGGDAEGPLQDGTYLFEVRAVSPTSGATTNPPAAWRFTVDTTGPTWAFDLAPPRNTSSTSAGFRFHPREPVSGAVMCSFDNRAPTDCSNGMASVTGLAEGTHTLAISAEDALGNDSTTTFAWRVDRTPPVATIVSGPEAMTYWRAATFTLSSNEQGGEFQCQLDDQATGACGDTPSYRGLADGSHVFTTWAIDDARNRSAPVSWTWTVDTVPPTLSGVGARPETFSPNGDGFHDTTAITASSNEPVKWLLVVRNSRNAIVISNYVSTPVRTYRFVWDGRDAFGRLLRNGYYSWWLNANDPVGNTTRTPTALIRIKGSPGTTSGADQRWQLRGVCREFGPAACDG